MLNHVSKSGSWVRLNITLVVLLENLMKSRRRQICQLALKFDRYLGNTDVHVQFEHEPVILSLNLTASKFKTGSDDPWQIVTMVFETQIKVYFLFESSRELAHRDISWWTTLSV